MNGTVQALNGLSAPAASLLGAAVTAIVGGAIAVWLNFLARRRDERDRRRNIYSEAYRAALEWCEGVYRVRRRPSDGSGDRALVEHFHELQERIAYYEGWLCIEAEPLGRAYQHFLKQVMGVCQPLLQEAWALQGRAPTVPKPADEVSPNITDAKETFLREVRRHLAPPWQTT
jgi:hypothetical protein